jgi:hypothetical protein
MAFGLALWWLVGRAAADAAAAARRRVVVVVVVGKCMVAMWTGRSWTGPAVRVVSGCLSERMYGIELDK